ncbi:hypothetical protein HNP71_000472 [Acidocella aromatica]|uniref:Uncharacterized protein n=1 Tax=Acidocella aromatica TaxID=1303579 RepID=A0A840V8G8_9PROT|nr:hypothetical protein [Acidocella aromatica]
MATSRHPAGFSGLAADPPCGAPWPARCWSAPCPLFSA